MEAKKKAVAPWRSGQSALSSFADRENSNDSQSSSAAHAPHVTQYDHIGGPSGAFHGPVFGAMAPQAAHLRYPCYSSLPKLETH